MSLYNKASLIQVPSLYKDGLLVSTVPEDRSGDFTVARGSNLSATRIGEDGYIKKGYENLLLQSNNFSDSVWGGAGIETPQTGYEGYDGTNDAWSLTSSVTGFPRITQNISNTGLASYSVYLKGNNDFFAQVRTFGINAHIWVELVGEGTISAESGEIYHRIDNLGNGWYRVQLTVDGTINSVRIYPASAVGVYSTSGNGILIQDAQLNQGLVAYPYLESTTAPAQGGLLENAPRLDWSNGVPAVFVEEQSTNDIALSEYTPSGNNAAVSYNQTLSPEGYNNALKLTITGTSQGGIITSNAYVSINTTYTQSCYVKKDVGDYFGFGLFQVGMPINNNNYIRWNLSDITLEPDVQGSYVNPKAEDVGNGWIRLSVTITTVDNGVKSGWKFLSMRSNSFQDSDVGNSFYIYGMQAEPNKTSVSSYIPTYGTSQTRSNETVSDTFTIPTTATIYNSFYAPASEQVYILDQVFSVSKGLNKVAIAFSPTAIKISVGGAIVASSTGSYDTTSLTSISLGSDSGADYSNAPISGFYIFPEFLTDDELNSLTA